MSEQPPWEQVERTALENRASGDDWYRRHLEKFRPHVIRDDADPDDVAFYELAVAADLAQETIGRARQAVADAAGANVEAGGKPEGRAAGARAGALARRSA